MDNLPLATGISQRGSCLPAQKRRSAGRSSECVPVKSPEHSTLLEHPLLRLVKSERQVVCSHRDQRLLDKLNHKLAGRCPNRFRASRLLASSLKITLQMIGSGLPKGAPSLPVSMLLLVGNPARGESADLVSGQGEPDRRVGSRRAAARCSISGDAQAIACSARSCICPSTA